MPAHRAFRVVAITDAVPELAALALLHDNVDVVLVLEDAMHLDHVQAALQFLQDGDLWAGEGLRWV